MRCVSGIFPKSIFQIDLSKDKFPDQKILFKDQLWPILFNNHVSDIGYASQIFKFVLNTTLIFYS